MDPLMKWYTFMWDTEKDAQQSWELCHDLVKSERDLANDAIKTAMQDGASPRPEPTSQKVPDQRTVSLDLPNLLPLAPLSLSFLAPDGFQYSIRIEKETEYQRMIRERQES